MWSIIWRWYTGIINHIIINYEWEFIKYELNYVSNWSIEVVFTPVLPLKKLIPHAFLILSYDIVLKHNEHL